MNNLTRVFLVLLRVAIGWLILVEGLDKIRSDNWSSAPYLRESTGPLAPQFREIAGDLVVQKAVPAPLPAGADPAKTPRHQRMPPELNREWDRYYAGFIAYYQLDPAQQKEAEAKFLQRKDQMANWLLNGKKVYKLTSPYGPPAPVERTTQERVADYLKKRDRAVEIETKELQVFGSEVNARLQAEKAEAGKIRSELLGSTAKAADWNKQLDAGLKAVQDKKKQVSDLERQIKDAELQKFQIEKDPAEKEKSADRLAKLDKSLPQIQAMKKEADAELSKLQDSFESLGVDLDVSKQTALMKRQLQTVLTPEQLKRDPMPERASASWDYRNWTRLEWSDNLVKYGLTAVGFCLLAGLFTRTACVAGAIFLLLFVLAMPPIPGVPDNPKLEGHYLYVNKTMILVLALLALGTTRSGRWMGIDGVFQFLNPWRKSDDEPQETPKPAEREAMTTHEPAAALTPAGSSPDNGSASPITAPITKDTTDGH
jgi:uncharacterized membrane protein YphA (DoxX/SURF4 family)